MNVQTKPLDKQVLRESVQVAIAPPILPATIEHTARKVFESFSSRFKKKLNGRQERALKLALDGHVTHKSSRIFSVRSERGNHAYLVNLDQSSCTCPDCRRGYVCKHRIAAFLIEQATEANNSVSQGDGRPPPSGEEDENIAKARLVLNAKSETLREAIIYATIKHKDESLNVEVISIERDTAVVRALPLIKNGNTLIPQFPFEGDHAITQVLVKSLSNIQIYR